MLRRVSCCGLYEIWDCVAAGLSEFCFSCLFQVSGRMFKNLRNAGCDLWWWVDTNLFFFLPDILTRFLPIWIFRYILTLLKVRVTDCKDGITSSIMEITRTSVFFVTHFIDMQISGYFFFSSGNTFKLLPASSYPLKLHFHRFPETRQKMWK